MNKGWIYPLIVGLVAAVGPVIAHEHGEGKHDKGIKSTKASDALLPVEIVGRVVAIPCLLQDPEGVMGPKHRDCIDNGLTPGLLADDGTLYVLLLTDHKADAHLDRQPPKEMRSVNATVAPYSGTMVTVTGKIRSRSRLMAIELTKVSPAQSVPGHSQPQGAAAQTQEAWVCPMGCEGKTHAKAGKCSVCGMALVKK